ncbi:hypothetical protein CVD25_23105 [Bacillus canaveralius]|uniref:SHOCT domain-containing protein n=1 Tax=Bacillus canaveralius TaxID=1403243 RepID=A0A2N5GG95_9BACI|nr:hypothetical protein [Bacillus canaveralius]PLR79762.1 hypothetical protein CU635_21350 [Bacillus canaveralius]PLR88010.1 hypothetical protein CVD25_23105 [Bacillus canaveralius]
MMNGHMGSFGSTYGGYGNGIGNGGFEGYPFGLNNFGWMSGMNLSGLLLIALIAFSLYLFFINKNQYTRLSPMKTERLPSIEAEEVIKLRYARGEISFDEFQSILKMIKS